MPEAQVSNTGAASNVVDLPVTPRPRGRPRGSKNRVGQDAKALLAKHAPATIRALCKLAAGASVRVPSHDGSHRVLTPDVDQMLTAQRIVVDRLVPALKATELSGGLDNTDSVTIEPADASTRDLAKSVLSLLASGAPAGGRVTVSDASEHVVRFHDGNLGRKLFPDSQNATSEFFSPAAVPGSPAAANAPAGSQDSSERKPEPGETFPVADGKGRIEYFGPDERSIPAWGVFGSRGYHARYPSAEAVRSAAERMAAEGKL